MSQIKNVYPKESYILEVQFDNGSSVLLNLEERLKTIRFGPLADKDFFRKVTTNGTAITWEDKVEIGINEIMLLTLK